MAEKSSWKPDADATLETVIRQTIAALGPSLKPEDLPHIVRQRISGAASGRADLDAICRRVLLEMKKRGEA